MKKYKQNIIPSVKVVARQNLAKYVKDYYTKHLQGKYVINKQLNIPINFTSDGRGKLAFGGNRYIRKAALIQCLAQLMEVAEYNNFGKRKDKDKNDILGYLNFKAKVKIGERYENIRIAVKARDNGVYSFAFYNYEINTIKK